MSVEIPIIEIKDLGPDEWECSESNIISEQTIRWFTERQARILGIHDGDTAKIEIIDWKEHPKLMPEYGRLDGQDAPEIGDLRIKIRKTALKARDMFQQLCQQSNGIVTLRIICPDKYGKRIICDFIDINGISIIETLAAAGMVRPYNGKGHKPW